MPGRARYPRRQDPNPTTVTPRQLLQLPPHVRMMIPLDGGFWLVDKRTNSRIRRITTDDLHKDEMRHQLNRRRAGQDDEETD